MVPVLLAASAFALPASASASTITVNGTGNNQAEDGVCTLVEAITSANANTESGNGIGGAPECIAGQAAPTVDVIAFALVGAGPHVISPTSNLPTISEAVTIDGSTEPDEVRLSGGSIGAAGVGLAVGTSDVTVDELSVVSFQAAGIDLSGSTGAVVRDSFIGTDPAGTAALGNGDGIKMGDTAATADAEIRDNVISGNTTEGILGFAQTSGVDIAGNRIGTGPGGAVALANGQEGVELIGGVDEITIGGDEPEDPNLISGNTGGGVRFFNSTTDRATDNVIEGNRIGTRVAGQQALGNGGPGVAMGGGYDSSEIRGNLISANGVAGVLLDDATPAPDGEDGPVDTTIAGNLIGSDVDGVDALGNASFGIRIAEEGDDHAITGTVIGGTSGLTAGGPCTGDCNVIAGTTGTVGIGSGIDLLGTEGTAVLGNHIGVDLAGTDGIPNGGDGFFGFDATDAQVGSAGAGNVIAANGESGVVLIGNDPGSATGLSVQANDIGVGADGLTPLGNGESGVFVGGFASQSLIGGVDAGDGNLIQNNADEGVTIAEDATDNAILGNSIAANGDLGIDLGNNATTPNDAGDADVGANDLQNFPVLNTAVAAADSTGVIGSLDSTADSVFRLELFAADAEGSNRGEGETFLGSLEVTTDAAGLASFAAVVDPVGAGDEITATATELDSQGVPLSTSEFSLNETSETCDVTGGPGDDALTGLGAGADVVCGLAGDDTFTPDGGADVFFGGEGSDASDYSAAAAAIDADLAAGTISDGTDTQLVVGVEELTGSGFDDLIDGDGLENVLKAGAGDDTVSGGEGDDELIGSDNADTLKGGDGDDEVKGQDGGDVMKGQSGEDDDLSGGPGKDNLNGGSGGSDKCNGGGNRDDEPAKGCEDVSNIP